MSLFYANRQIPLAETLRPKTLDEFLGQNQVVEKDSPVYNLLKSGRLFSMILWGPPGCGKTTLFRIVAGLLKSTQGKIILDGKEIIEPGEIGLVYQDYTLFPWQNVLQNVIFGIDYVIIWFCYCCSGCCND